MLDDTKHQCTWRGEDIQLTVTEFLLVKALGARPDMVKSHDQLIDAAMARTSMSTIARSTATCIRKKSSGRWTTASTRSKLSTASATGTRSADALDALEVGLGSQTTGDGDISWAAPRSLAGYRRCCAILLVNALPLVLLVAVLLASGSVPRPGCCRPVLVLREKARIYAGALDECRPADRVRLAAH